MGSFSSLVLVGRLQLVTGFGRHVVVRPTHLRALVRGRFCHSNVHVLKRHFAHWIHLIYNNTATATATATTTTASKCIACELGNWGTGELGKLRHSWMRYCLPLHWMTANSRSVSVFLVVGKQHPERRKLIGPPQPHIFAFFFVCQLWRLQK